MCPFARLCFSMRVSLCVGAIVFSCVFCNCLSFVFNHFHRYDSVFLFVACVFCVVIAVCAFVSVCVGSLVCAFWFVSLCVSVFDFVYDRVCSCVCHFIFCVCLCVFA